MLGSRTLAGANKIGSPWLETSGSVERNTHTHTHTETHIGTHNMQTHVLILNKIPFAYNLKINTQLILNRAPGGERGAGEGKVEGNLKASTWSLGKPTSSRVLWPARPFPHQLLSFSLYQPLLGFPLPHSMITIRMYF